MNNRELLGKSWQVLKLICFFAAIFHKFAAISIIGLGYERVAQYEVKPLQKAAVHMFTLNCRTASAAIQSQFSWQQRTQNQHTLEYAPAREREQFINHLRPVAVCTNSRRQLGFGILVQRCASVSHI